MKFLLPLFLILSCVTRTPKFKVGDCISTKGDKASEGYFQIIKIEDKKYHGYRVYKGTTKKRLGRSRGDVQILSINMIDRLKGQGQYSVVVCDRKRP